MTIDLAKAPYRPVDMEPPTPTVEQRADGSILVGCSRPLQPYPDSVLHWLEKWAQERPHHIYMAQRTPDGADWERLTYAEALASARAVGQGLLDKGLSAKTPVIILSGNSLTHALLALGAMMAGIPVAPVSPAYSAPTSDGSKVLGIVKLTQPGLIFAEDGSAFETILRKLAGVAPLYVQRHPPKDLKVGTFAELISATPGEALDQARAKVGLDTVAKILFTSGSTGVPKGVINTQRMMVSNQAMVDQTIHLGRYEPPVYLDWLPWNHTFGGNYNFNTNLRLGGTLYIDGGRPVPGLFDTTIRNLKEIAPSYYGNVPVGYAMLAAALEDDQALRENFFSKVGTFAYGGAVLQPEVWTAMQTQAVRTIGQKIVFISGWGSTETAPTATQLHWPNDGATSIGLPLPGVTVKLAPTEDNRHELRVKGPIIFPGYLRDPEATKAAFDEEGYYRTGDAGVWVTPGKPEDGLAFDGRLAETFKLTSGTWVAAGMLRVKVIEALAPALQDLVICGHDRERLTALAWPALAGCRKIAALAEGTDPATVIANPKVRDFVLEKLRAFNKANPGSSTKITGLLLMAEPPSPDAGEITDKGYINQRLTRENRKDLVTALYADPPGPDVLVP